MVKRLLLLALCLLLLAGVAVHGIWTWWQEPVRAEPAQIVTVAEGSSLAAVASELQRVGLLERPKLWTLMARLRGEDASIKRGEYRFGGDVSPAELLRVLVDGRVVTYSVTLPEGITLQEALGILQAQPALEAVLDGTGDARLQALVQPHPAPEGLFFPDTYRFTRGETDLDVLETAHHRMLDVLDAAWAVRDPSLPYEAPYDALIMSSIVEKETGVAGERGQIAGVFLRRLERGMRLQTDPTVIYGLGGGFDGNLRRRHLDDAGNPFNTYRHKGLPPTPIALPGKAAIEAAMHPEPGNTLYFVARGDGSHEFSETLEQHTAAVRQYQLKRRKDYRSAPAEQRP